MSSWFRGWSQDKRPPDKPECLVVCESLLMELNYQINEAILREREKDQEERRKSTGVDYSWLVTEVPKSYEIPELDKLELEELCMKIKARECTIVITEFRKCLLQDRKPADITRLFRSVVLQVLDARPVEQSMSNWMMKSLTSLRPLSSKITPINAGPLTQLFPTSFFLERFQAGCDNFFWPSDEIFPYEVFPNKIHYFYSFREKVFFLLF